MYRENAKPKLPAPTKLEPYDARFDLDARIIVTAAIHDALDSHELDVTPERLLVAAFEDPDIASSLGDRRRAIRERLLEEMAEEWHAGEAFELPCRRTLEVVERAESRASANGRWPLSRGDLLFGLATTPGFAGHVVRESRISLELIDVEREHIEPILHVSPASATHLTVVLRGDRRPTTPHAIKILEEVFSLSRGNAVWQLVTANVIGHTRLGTYEGATAMALASRAVNKGRTRGTPFTFEFA